VTVSDSALSSDTDSLSSFESASLARTIRWSSARSPSFVTVALTSRSDPSLVSVISTAKEAGSAVTLVAAASLSVADRTVTEPLRSGDETDGFQSSVGVPKPPFSVARSPGSSVTHSESTTLPPNPDRRISCVSAIGPVFATVTVGVIDSPASYWAGSESIETSNWLFSWTVTSCLAPAAVPFASVTTTSTVYVPASAVGTVSDSVAFPPSRNDAACCFPSTSQTTEESSVPFARAVISTVAFSPTAAWLGPASETAGAAASTTATYSVSLAVRPALSSTVSRTLYSPVSDASKEVRSQVGQSGWAIEPSGLSISHEYETISPLSAYDPPASR
jgi:hypothetical protein